MEEDVSFGPRNLGLAEEDVEKRVKDTLMTLDLQELAGRHPGQLSQGQKRLTAIAGVVSMRPSIIALDEPTSDMDEKSSQAILSVLEGFHREGRTIILATHDVDLASRWADEIILLAEGRVLAQGTPADVFYGLDGLEDLGIRVPAAVQLIKRLSRLGLVDPGVRVMSLEELLAALLVAVKQA